MNNAGDRNFLLVVFFFVLTAVAGTVGYSYYSTTGGSALTRIVYYYLLRNIPDKEYHWRDFTDQGPTAGITGFYSSGDENGFSLWTLSGLKKFTNLPGTSVYMHEDVCTAVKELSENSDATEGTTLKAPQQVTPDILTWENLMKKEYLVTVLRMDNQDNPNLVDKVWSYSGKYKIINQLDLEACN